MSKKHMSSWASTAIKGGKATYHEILTRINNAKDKPKKLQILKDYDSEPLRMLMKVHLTLIYNGTYQLVFHHLKQTRHLLVHNILG